MDGRGPATTSMSEVERRLLRIVRSKRRLTFLAIADLFPQLPWQVLFKGLFALQSRNRLTLRPLRWDYEVMVRDPSGGNRADRTPRACARPSVPGP